MDKKNVRRNKDEVVKREQRQLTTATTTITNNETNKISENVLNRLPERLHKSLNFGVRCSSHSVCLFLSTVCFLAKATAENQKKWWHHQSST